MKSTIQKSLYTLFLASYIFSASCFASNKKALKTKKRITSFFQKKEEKSNPKIDKSKKKKDPKIDGNKKKRANTVDGKYLLFISSLTVTTIVFMLSKRSNTSNNGGGHQIPQGNNTSNSSGGSITPLIDDTDQNVKEIKALIQNGRNVNALDNAKQTFLYKHLEEGNKEAIRYLIEDEGADVNLICCGEAPLHVACRNCQKDMVELLLRRGADAKKKAGFDNRSPLYTICSMTLKKDQRQDAVEIIQLLVQHGADVLATSDDETALSMVCNHHYNDLAEELIKHGADVTETSGYSKDNLLINTCRSGSSDIEDLKNTIKLLLSNNININAKNSADETALHMACKHQKKEIVEYLIGQGAQLNAASEGDLPIHYACKNSNALEIVNLLINKNDVASSTEQFDLDKKNHKNETPLYIAGCYKRFEALDLLIEKYKANNILVEQDLKNLMVTFPCEDELKNIIKKHFGEDGYNKLYKEAFSF